jgi:hypothetical protein
MKLRTSVSSVKPAASSSAAARLATLENFGCVTSLNIRYGEGGPLGLMSIPSGEVNAHARSGANQKKKKNRTHLLGQVIEVRESFERARPFCKPLV